MIKKWNLQNRARDVAEVLNSRNFDAHAVDTAEEAQAIVRSILKEGDTIAVGGSVTLNETGIMDIVRDPAYHFIDRFNCSSWDETQDKYRQGFLSDVFISGTNAITMGGQLVNLDCTGNRTGCIEFGPKKVIIVVGANKVVDTLEEGIRRAKRIAPMNAKRIDHKTPCCTDGHCANCTGENRICNIWSVIDGCYKYPKRITVIIIAEELGY